MTKLKLTKPVVSFLLTLMILAVLLFAAACSANTEKDGSANTGPDTEIPSVPDPDPTLPPENPDEPNLPEDPQPEPIPPLSTRYKVQSLANVNVRSAPSTSNTQVLGLLYQSQFAPFYTKISDSWYMILFQGKVAYISASGSYTRLVDINAESKSVESVITEGVKVLGVPYQYGAPRLLNWDYSLNAAFTGKTFDCSSFVQYAFYRGAGVKLNMDTRSQSTQGSPVAFSDLRRGDAIYMTSSAREHLTGIERIGHVAIYLGNNQILHTYGTGGVVIQDYSAFWKGRFILARRMM